MLLVLCYYLLNFSVNEIFFVQELKKKIITKKHYGHYTVTYPMTMIPDYNIVV